MPRVTVICVPSEVDEAGCPACPGPACSHVCRCCWHDPVFLGLAGVTAAPSVRGAGFLGPRAVNTLPVGCSCFGPFVERAIRKLLIVSNLPACFLVMTAVFFGPLPSIFFSVLLCCGSAVSSSCSVYSLTVLRCQQSAREQTSVPSGPGGSAAIGTGFAEQHEVTPSCAPRPGCGGLGLLWRHRPVALMSLSSARPVLTRLRVAASRAVCASFRCCLVPLPCARVIGAP